MSQTHVPEEPLPADEAPVTAVAVVEEPPPAAMTDEPAVTADKPAAKPKVPHPLPVYKKLEDVKKGSKLRQNLDVFGVLGSAAVLVLLGVWKLIELVAGLF